MDEQQVTWSTEPRLWTSRMFGENCYASLSSFWMFGPSHEGGSHNSLVPQEAFAGTYRLGQDQHSNLLLPTVRGVVIQACRGVEV